MPNPSCTRGATSRLRQQSATAAPSPSPTLWQPSTAISCGGCSFGPRGKKNLRRRRPRRASADARRDDADFCARKGAACGSGAAPQLWQLARADCGACDEPTHARRTSAPASPRATPSCAPPTDPPGSLSAPTDAANRATSRAAALAPGKRLRLGCAPAPRDPNYSFLPAPWRRRGSISGTDVCGQPAERLQLRQPTLPDLRRGGTAKPVRLHRAERTPPLHRQEQNCGSVSRHRQLRHLTPGTAAHCTSRRAAAAAEPPRCGCTAESNAQFCNRLGKELRLGSAADNCGTSRTVSCGKQCPANQTLRRRRHANLCGCTAETQAQAVAQIDEKSCAPLQTSRSCGVLRALDCGSCTGGQVCGANGLSETAGTVATFHRGQTATTAVAGIAQLPDGDISHARHLGPRRWDRQRQVAWCVSVGERAGILPSRHGSSYGRGLWSSSAPSGYRGTLGLFTSTQQVDAADSRLRRSSIISGVNGTASDDVWVAANSPTSRHQALEPARPGTHGAAHRLWKVDECSPSAAARPM